jgi:hypothetical protein
MARIGNRHGANTEAQYRRFESIAWIILGGSKVTAACFDGTDILLGANYTKDLANPDASLGKMQEFEQDVNRAVGYLKEVADLGAFLENNIGKYDAKTELKYKDKIERLTSKYKSLTDSATVRIKAIHGPKQNNRLPGNRTSRRGKDSNRAGKGVPIMSNTEALIERFKNSLAKTTNSILARYMNIEGATAFSKEFCTALEKDNIQYLFLENPRDRNNSENRDDKNRYIKGVHAEQQIVDWLINWRKLQNAAEPYYIGISKKCCLLCEHLIMAVNKVMSTPQLIDDPILVRDKGHKKQYPAGVPRFLEHKGILEEAGGEELKLKIEKAFITSLKTEQNLAQDIQDLLYDEKVNIEKIFRNGAPEEDGAVEAHARSQSRAPDVMAFGGVVAVIKSRWEKDRNTTLEERTEELREAREAQALAQPNGQARLQELENQLKTDGLYEICELKITEDEKSWRESAERLRKKVQNLSME